MEGRWREWDRLRVKEIRVLAALRGSLSGLSPKEVSVMLGLPSGTAHGVLTKLVALGLAERRDGLYFITAKGEEALKAIEMVLKELRR